MTNFKKNFLAVWDELDEPDRREALETLLDHAETFLSSFEGLKPFVRKYMLSEFNELNAAEKAAALAQLPASFFQHFPEFLEQTDQSGGH